MEMAPRASVTRITEYFVSFLTIRYPGNLYTYMNIQRATSRARKGLLLGCHCVTLLSIVRAASTTAVPEHRTQWEGKRETKG